MITSSGNQNHHWNYFISIEKDMETLSRYIEFSGNNYDTYSIELAHILLSASSEVDVVLKQLCQALGIDNCENILHYREAIMTHSIGAKFANEEITISRFGLTYKPFENWNNGTSPDWWAAYNKVKHFRHDNFYKANLKNVLNAVGALLITVVHFYRLEFSRRDNKEVSFPDVIARLNPMSSIMDISGDDYRIALLRVQ